MYQDVSNYLEQQVQHASPAQLIDLLFARARRDLTEAFELHSLQGDIRVQAEAIRCIVHAQQILTELSRSLNRKDGGQIAANLSRIYEYMQFRLKDAIDGRKNESVKEVRELLEGIHESWRSVLDQPNVSADGPNARETASVLVA